VSGGQALVEFALVLPVLLLLFLAAVDLGRLFYAYVGVENAAREGAAYGMSHSAALANTPVGQAFSDPTVTTVARREMGGDTHLTVMYTCNSTVVAANCAPSAPSTTSAGNTLNVQATYAFTFLSPVVPSVTLSATATAVFSQ